MRTHRNNYSRRFSVIVSSLTTCSRRFVSGDWDLLPKDVSWDEATTTTPDLLTKCVVCRKREEKVACRSIIDALSYAGEVD